MIILNIILSLLIFYALNNFVGEGQDLENILIKKLDNPEESKNAAKKLADIGSVNAIPHLITLITSSRKIGKSYNDICCLDDCIQIIIEKKKSDALKILLGIFYHQDKFIRQESLRQIALCLQEADEILPELRKEINHYDKMLVVSVARLLIYLDKNPEFLLQPMIIVLGNHEAGDNAAEILLILSKIGVDIKPAMNNLIHQFRYYSSIYYSCPSTKRALMEIGESVVQPLSKLLKDPISNVRGEAALIIGKIGKDKDAASVVPELLKLINDSDLRVQGNAIDAIGMIKKNINAINDLIKIAKNVNSPNRLKAIRALGEINNESDIVVNELLRLIDIKEPEDVRCIAMKSIAKMRVKNQNIIDRLVIAVKDPCSCIRIWASCFLIEIFPERETEFINMLGEELRNDYWEAADAIKFLGPRAIRSAPALINKIINWDFNNIPSTHTTEPGESEIEFPYFAIDVIQEIGIDSNGLKSIKMLIKAKEPIKRLLALDILIRFGPAIKSEIKLIKENLNDPNPEIRKKAVLALGAIGKVTEKDLKEALKLKDRNVRYYAWAILKRFELEEKAKTKIKTNKILKINKIKSI